MPKSKAKSRHVAAVISGGKKILALGTSSMAGTSKICPHAVTRHAEMDAIYKVILNDKRKLKGATIWSMRWFIRGEELEAENLTMAKPCLHCNEIMKKYGIKKCVWSDWNGEIVCQDIYSIDSSLSTGSKIKNATN